MTHEDAQALAAEVEQEPSWHAEATPDFFARSKVRMHYPPDWSVEIWHDEVPGFIMGIKQQSEWPEMRDRWRE